MTIDYKKLEKAHELAQKLPDDYSITHHWTNYRSSFLDNFRLHEGDNGDFQDFECIDALIEKLEELIKQAPKFNKGDDVWFSWGRDIRFATIDSYTIDAYDQYMYTCGGYHVKESQLYPTRELLIRAERDFWKSQYDNQSFEGQVVGFSDFKDCKHEPDGEEHIFTSANESGHLSTLRCKHCKRFFGSNYKG